MIDSFQDEPVNLAERANLGTVRRFKPDKHFSAHARFLAAAQAPEHEVTLEGDVSLETQASKAREEPADCRRVATKRD